MHTEIWHFLVSGGPIMAPIGVLSVIGVAIFFERLMALRLNGICPLQWSGEVVELVRSGNNKHGLDKCNESTTPLSRLFAVALESQKCKRSELKELVEERGRIETAQLERNISLLGTIASVAPLLGLMGTVWGMILTFEAIQSEGMGSVSGLAGGISQALVTTFAGLAVGIPAFIAHRWSNRRIDRIALMLEEESLKLISAITDEDSK